MKKIMPILYFLLLLFISLIDANAANGKLGSGDIEMECIYDNGVLITAYNSGGSYGLTATDIKLSNKIELPISGSSGNTTIFYNEEEFAKSILESASCPNYIHYGIMNQYNEDQTALVSFPVISRYEDSKYYSCSELSSYELSGATQCSKKDSGFDSAFFKKKFSANFKPYDGFFSEFSVEKDSILYKRGIQTWKSGSATVFYFNLVNERIYFTNDVEPINRWAFKSAGQQATSKNLYAKLYLYKTPNGTAKYFLEKDQVITTLYWDDVSVSDADDRINWLCMASSSKKIENNKNDMGFNFSRIRHVGNVKNTLNTEIKNSCSMSIYTLYKEVDWDEAEEAGNSPTSICDIIPNTALVLAEIVNIARIIVPAFLIVLTGVDISRIVISGNLDEQLPKRRKNIIIRFIVAMFFFFLPLFIQVIVSSSYGLDFGDVSCIWN